MKRNEKRKREKKMNSINQNMLSSEKREQEISW